MKTWHCITLVVGLFVLALWYGEHAVGFPNGFTAFRMPDPGNVRWGAALEWTATALGTAIAGISALRLLQCAIQKAKLPEILSSVVALFGGLLLYQRHLAVAISFAAIIVGWLIVGYLRSLEKKGDDDRGA